MKLLLLTLITLLPFISYAQLEPNFDYVYSQSDTIRGQVETAKRVSYYFNAKKYKEGIKLFSQKQQAIIHEYKEDDLVFASWCMAWTLSDEALKEYIAKIESGYGRFVFEDGMWKINET